MAKNAADGTERREPAASDDDVRIERRRQPRDMEAPPDWEMIVLQRMAERVKSLSGEPDAGKSVGSDGNWEEATLLALRRRMNDLQSK